MVCKTGHPCRLQGGTCLLHCFNVFKRCGKSNGVIRTAYSGGRPAYRGGRTAYTGLFGYKGGACFFTRGHAAHSGFT